MWTTFLVYSTSFLNGFVLDDFDLIVNNPFIKVPSLYSHLLKTNIYQFASQSSTDYYRPLPMLTHAVEYFLWKLHPLGYHLVNIFLHGMNAFVLYLVLKKLVKNSELCWMACIVYAIHPLQSSVVLFVSARGDLLVALFGLSSIYSFIRYLEEEKGAKLGLSVLFFMLAILSRESAMLLPLYLLVIVCLPAYRDNKRRNGLLYFLLILTLYLAFRFFILKFPIRYSVSFSSMPFHLQVSHFFYLIGQYIYLFFMPWPLYPVRSVPFMTSLNWAHWLLTLGGIGLIVYSLYRLATKKLSDSVFGFLWMIVGLVPLWRLMYYNPRLGAIMAENWFYMPMAGMGLIFSEFLCKKTWGKTVYYVALALFASQTLTNNLNWMNEKSLYTHTLNSSSSNEWIRFNLAEVYLREGNYQKAYDETKKVLINEPKSADAYYQFADILAAMGKTEAAEANYLKAIELKPTLAGAYQNLGILYEKAGKDDRAFHFFTKALRANPWLWQGHGALGDYYARKEDFKRAREEYKEALILAPENGDLWSRMGFVDGRLGNDKAAQKSYERAVKFSPASWEAFKGLGISLANQRKYKQASSYFKKAVQLRPNDVVLRRLLKKAREDASKH